MWLKNLWDLVHPLLTASHKILSNLEQQIIWEKIILSAKLGSVLIDVPNTAKQAVNAWNMLLQWDLAFPSIVNELEYGSAPQVFKTWAETYQQMCAENSWLDVNAMLNVLIDNLAKFQQYLPKECCLVEHQELTPQHRRFFTALTTVGVKVVEKKLTSTVCPNIAVLPVATQDLEYKAVANWAVKEWQNNPNIRLGIVVTDLALSRNYIASEFAAYFTEPVYNISAPKNILQYGIIELAFLLLDISNNTTVNINDLAKLLRSSFIGDAETEMLARAMFIKLLRADSEQNFTLQYLQQQLLEFMQQPTSCQNFIQMYINWLQFIPELAGKHDTSYWVSKVKTILHIWQWPGEQNIDVTERQLIVCWESLLQTYQQLDFILQEHDFNQAYKILQKLAITTPFLPETGKLSIHVLGVLEAAGLPFDKLWVMGMHNNAWPAAAAPNPFLPINMQRQFNLPRSSPARELAVAAALTDTFCRSTSLQVIFSFPKLIDDVPTMASRLLNNFAVDEQLLSQVNLYRAKQSYAGTMEVLLDEKAPAYQPTATVVAGGSKAIQLQANCPFWAFAEIRLRALPSPRVNIGLTPAQRGSILHKVLAQVWQHLKTSSALATLEDAELTILLGEAINLALTQMQKKRPLTLTENYVALESKRMAELIKKWLLYEQNRSDFVVYQIEQQYLYRVGTLNFNLRIDRIDKLTNGEIVILDYKTGKPQINDWFSERMQNPQLPMYCLATKLNPSSIAFAVLRPDSIQFKGVGNRAGILPDVVGLDELNQVVATKTWDEQLQDWQLQLEKTAAEFCQGIASVQPTSVNSTCRHCQLQAFCRIHERVVN